MTRLTNKLGLPSAFANFEERNPHDGEGADYTVTTLIDSPRVHRLKCEHEHEITEDVSDRIFSILGTAVHTVLEKGAREGDIVEQRFHAEYNQFEPSVSVSGQVDLQERGRDGITIVDYKTCSASTIRYNPAGKPEWQSQLNFYAHLARHNGVQDIVGLEVVAICRDWRKASYNVAAKNGSFYPESPVVRVPIEMWEPEVASEYAWERIAIHEEAKVTLPDCSAEEMWTQPEKWPVYKGKAKRASRLLPTQTAALIFADEKTGDAELVAGTYWVGEKRPAIFTRCDSYCAAAPFCEQKAKREEN
tara:strand:+ start:3102 stop:4013 length:912 start_codon:yes stop_codon:yes gene_type:complete